MPKAKYSPLYTRLRELLVEARRNAGLQQVDVAKRLGRPQSFVSKIESGERRLDIAEFVEVADVVGVDPVKLLKQAISSAR